MIKDFETVPVKFKFLKLLVIILWC